MTFDFDKYVDALEDEYEDMDLAFVDDLLDLSIVFDPRKHPRDFLGRFREVLDGLDVGDVVELPDDTRVEKLPNGQAKFTEGGSDVLDETVELERTFSETPLDSRLRQVRESAPAPKVDEELAGFINELNQKSQEADVVVRMPYDNFWEFLRDGRYYTQHESGTSEGVYNPNLRREVEDQWWPGVEVHPIYGFLKGTELEWSTEQYGPVQMVLKPEVKERTTFTLGDSLDDHPLVKQIPMPIGGVDAFAIAEIFVRDTPKQRADLERRNLKLTDRLREDLDDYVTYWEAQIFGGVTPDDIAELLFEVEPDAAMRKELETLGIPWRVGK